jgi:hypothetical protein
LGGDVREKDPSAPDRRPRDQPGFREEPPHYAKGLTTVVEDRSQTLHSPAGSKEEKLSYPLSGAVIWGSADSPEIDAGREKERNARGDGHAPAIEGPGRPHQGDPGDQAGDRVVDDLIEEHRSVESGEGTAVGTRKVSRAEDSAENPNRGSDVVD